MKHLIGIIILALIFSCSRVRENEIGVTLDSKTAEVKETFEGPTLVLISNNAILKTMDKSRIDTIEMVFLTADGKELSRRVEYRYSINSKRVDEYLKFGFSRYSKIDEIKEKVDNQDFRAATRNAFGNFHYKEFKMQKMPAGWLEEVRRYLHENYIINSGRIIR